MKIFRFILYLIYFSIIIGCTTPIKKHGEKIVVSSKDYQFIDDLLYKNDYIDLKREIYVWVTLPDSKTFPPPYPAVVLLHSSWGLSSQEWHYAKAFQKIGIATVAIDSFESRRVAKTSLDQTLVSSASMIADAFSVLNYLHSDIRFDSERVGVLGFSKGGVAALYSSMRHIQHTLSNELQFAVHISYYPWCGLYLHDSKTTGAPILIQGGSKDVVTPISKCRDLTDYVQTKTDYSNITIIEHRLARHAFDHPALAIFPFPISMNVQVPSNCKIREIERNKFVEVKTNKTVSNKNIKETLMQCSTFTGIAGYDSESADVAQEKTLEFLTNHLLISK